MSEIKIKRVTRGFDSPTMPETCYTPVVNGIEQLPVAETPEVAYLLGLQIKYDGLNSEFTKYACRMLGIDSVWSR